MKTQKSFHFELVDSDGEVMGMIRTNLPSDAIQKYWTEYYESDDFDGDVENFIIDVLRTKPDYVFAERSWFDETIAP